MQRLFLLLITSIAFIYSSTASAILINTTDGAINSTAGTVAIGDSASYVSGGTGLTGYGTVYPADAGDGLANVSQEASNIDRYWLQFNSTNADQAGSIKYQFNSATDTVVAVSGIDHGPLPYEALEFIVWGWTGSGWEEGKISAIYDDGVDAAWAYDDFSSVWTFSAAYTLFAVSGGDHLGIGGTEGEIDGLAMLANVPEPATVLLLLFGLIGLRFRFKSAAIR